ncbi:hypothetical protein [Curvibacter delicatus]|uniref:hypothetical protein n=1 Tax=Curvibacter delicatus TaxID=80879 RepID=UPI001FE01780|nr:hypothetical protein [Curvibacter delicatus]
MIRVVVRRYNMINECRIVVVLPYMVYKSVPRFLVAAINDVYPCQIIKSIAKTDMGFHGVSYWRRAHQLPGVDHCTKHTVSLIETGRFSMHQGQPLSALAARPAIAEQNVHAYFESAFIQRFAILSDAALQASIPFRPEVVTRALCRRVRAVIGEHRVSLSQLARQYFPDFWIRKNFPAMFGKRPDDGITAVDDVLRSSRSAYTTKSYLLALSILWDDPDEAMRACLQEAALSTSGFNEKGGRKVLRDVLGGRSITQSCRRHDVNLRDFEYAFQEFLKEIRPVVSVYAAKL